MKALVCRAIADDIGTLKIEDMTLPPLGAGRGARAHARGGGELPRHPDGAGQVSAQARAALSCGSEGAGDVIAVGDGVTKVKVGDRVIGGGLGGFAEEMQVPAATLAAHSAERRLCDSGRVHRRLSDRLCLAGPSRARLRSRRMAAGAWRGRRRRPGGGRSRQDARRARHRDGVDGREARIPEVTMAPITCCRRQAFARP